jgi:hypothetical protein
VVGTIVVCTTVGWLLLEESERAAAATVQTSFDEYNRYIEACDGRTEGEAWDLATRAHEVLRRASAERALAEARQSLLLRLGSLAGAALVAGFYAFRWALTGRWRPLWLSESRLRQPDPIDRGPRP